jgi:hypothetical protein
MYAFGSLPSNLVAFADVLRREYGFRIASGELQDAARALEVVDLFDEQAVRDALRPVLSMSSSDAGVFDRAFTAFFYPGPAGAPQLELEPARREFSRESPVPDVNKVPDPRAAPPEASGAEELAESGAATSFVPAMEPGEGTARLGRSSYSPLDVEAAGDAPELTSADPPWRDAARAVVRRLHLGLTRRFRPAVRGHRFDLRRTLRASLQTGGEPLTARWLRRPRRSPKFVLLIDGSRSMGAHAQTALQIAVALATATMRVEVFTFSTALRRVTDDVRRAAAGKAVRLERLRRAWAGGTSIGACLREFLGRFGERTLGRDTVVMIVSDGLDIGEADVLRAAMQELRRRSAGLVWLNPLLETPGYEPTASGMSTARPYVTTFASANDVVAFARLSRVVRLRV